MLSKILIGLGLFLVFLFGQALFVVPDLCKMDGSLQTCVRNGLGIIIVLLSANALILSAMYFKKNG